MSLAAPRPGSLQRRRLAGADAGFLYIESESQTSTCTQAVVLAPPGPDQQPVTLADVRARLAERLDRAPHLRRKLHQVPGGIGHAVWADDPNFELDDHLSGATLENAGEPAAALDDQLAHLTATRFSLDQPPWHVMLVDGFADGSQALVTRFHHVLGDGAAVVTLLSELFDDAAETRPSVATPADLAPQPPPSRLWLFLVTAVRQFFVWLTLPWLLVRSARRFRAVRRRRDHVSVRVPEMARDAPPTVLNTSADNRRALSRAVLPLADMRAVRQAADTTLSDVVIAVVAGGVRQHLLERSELPLEPLIVNVPVGNDDPDAPARLRGNVFVNYYAVLPTDIDDPVQRLEATATHTAEAKLQLEIQGRDTLTTWLDRIPPALAGWAARVMAEKSRTGENPPDFNVLVSNMRIPGEQWGAWGREVTEVVLTGPVTDGYGLNITVSGYGDHLTCAVHSNPGAVADPEALARGLEAELALLVDATAPRKWPTSRGMTPGEAPSHPPVPPAQPTSLDRDQGHPRTQSEVG